MPTFLPYILKSSTILVVLLVYYQLFLKRQTFFKLNRVYLLATLVLSFIIPCISIEINRNDIQGLHPLAYVNGLLEETHITATSTDTLQANESYSFNMIPFLYCIGVLFFLIRYLISLGQLYRFSHKNPCKRLHGLNIVKTHEGQPTFSFFNYLFINTISLSQQNKKKIFAHEKIHIQQCHSLDLCIAEIICIANWFNPLVWLFKHLILENHEYIADQQVIRNFKISDYLELLIQQSLKGNFSFINYLSRSNLQKRTIMMTRKQSHKYKIINYLPVFLVIGSLFFLFSFKNKYKDNDPIGQIFQVVEDMPSFKGDLSAWIAQNIKYPSKAIKQGIEGRVFVQFVIDSTGKVRNSTIVHNTNEALDKEVLKAMKTMPDWEPGKQRKHKVNVSYTLAIQFSLAQNGSLSPTVNVLYPNPKVIVPQPASTEKVVPTSSLNNQIFQVVEDMPVFTQGDIHEWISKNIKYPADAKKEKKSGSVYVSFVVEKDGRITEARILRGSSPALDAEALRLVKAMPAWTPGKQRGKPVRVGYTLPIRFSLD